MNSPWEKFHYPSSFPLPASNNGFKSTTAFGLTNKTLTVCDCQRGALGVYYYPTSGGSGGLTSRFDAGTADKLIGLDRGEAVPASFAVVDSAGRLLLRRTPLLEPELLAKQRGLFEVQSQGELAQFHFAFHTSEASDEVDRQLAGDSSMAVEVFHVQFDAIRIAALRQIYTARELKMDSDTAQRGDAQADFGPSFGFIRSVQLE